MGRKVKRSKEEEALRDEAAGVLCRLPLNYDGSAAHQRGHEFVRYHLETDVGLYRAFLSTFLTFRPDLKHELMPEEQQDVPVLWRRIWFNVLDPDSPEARRHAKQHIFTARAPEHVLRRLIAMLEPDPLVRMALIGACEEEEAKLDYSHIRFSSTQHLDFIADEG